MSTNATRRPPAVSVSASLSLHALKGALREATINNEDFDVGWWSIWDAECLEAAAALIRREIVAREDVAVPSSFTTPGAHG